MKKRKVVLLALCIITLIVSVCAFFACNVFPKPDGKNDPEKTEADKIFTVEDSTITGLTEYGKTLTELEIPGKIGEKDMTRIDRGAFGGCGGLTEIHYNRTIEQWKTIEKGSNWDSKTGGYTVYCTDGNLA